MSIYLQADKLKGNVTAKGFEQAVECETLDIHMGRHVHTRVGVTNHRETGLPQISAVRIAKRADNSSVQFAQALLKAQNFPQVTISLAHHAGNSALKTHTQYTFKNVLVSGYHEYIDRMTHSPMEMITLSFTQLEKRYTPRNTDNTDGSPMTTSYDLTTGLAL